MSSNHLKTILKNEVSVCKISGISSTPEVRMIAEPTVKTAGV